MDELIDYCSNDIYHDDCMQRKGRESLFNNSARCVSIVGKHIVDNIQNKKSIRRMAIILAAIALMSYGGFILIFMLQA
jgi:hypothetical protein